MKNFSIGKKLSIGFSVLISLILAVSILSIYDFKKVDNELNSNLHISVQKLDTLLMLDKMVNSYGYSLLGSFKSNNPEDIQMFKDFSNNYKNDVYKYEKNLVKLIEDNKTTHNEQKENDFMKKLLEQRQILDSYFANMEVLQAKNPEEARTYFNTKVLPLWDNYRKEKRDFLSYYHNLFTSSNNEIHEDNQSSIIAISIFTVFAIILAIAFAFYITNSITKPLAQALKTSKEVANGIFVMNYHNNTYNKDETGELLRSIDIMKSNLSQMITDIKNNSIHLENASSEIAQGNLDLSSRTEEQAASLEETAATMEQITVTVKNTSENANNVNKLAQELTSNASSGANMVKEVSLKFVEIQKSSTKIEEIINVIDGIAFQTNILALNAAVEAARAGEYGRGFSVVASEVQTLSQRSAQAAKEIKTLILSSSNLIEESAVFTHNVNEAISHIAINFKQVSDIIEEINIASNEQSHSISQINFAISQMDQVTQQNAALVEESAAAANSLKQQSIDLSTLVEKFSIQ